MFDWVNKRILVTGGSGFIGGSLVERLINLGSTVDIIDNFSVGKPDTVPEGVNELYEGDVCKSLLDQIDHSYDIVFHFGSPCTVLLFDKDPLKFYFNSVTGSYSIREFCRRKKIKYLVYASSATYYGLHSTDYWNLNNRYKYQEDMPMTPVSMYGLEKCTEENLDHLFYDIPYKLSLRIFPTYGYREYIKGDIASPVYQFARSMLKGDQPIIWGDGTQTRDFIYIDDLVYCIIGLVERNAIGSYNIGTGTSVDFNWIVKVINEILDVDIKPKYIDCPFDYTYVKDLRSDITKLKMCLGDIDLVPIEVGISKMIFEMILNGF